MNHQHRQWNSRGYLPHCDQPRKIQSVTIRLHDSMPVELRRQWEELLKREPQNQPPRDPGRPARFPLKTPTEDAAQRRAIEAWLDAGHGSCALRDPAVAAIVEDSLLFGDGTRYHLLSWVIMPNHVHFVFEMVDGWPLGEVMQGIKSYTSHEVNRLLNRSGDFWYPDYRDRYVRDLEHLRNITDYIHQNPVKAGLVATPEDWPWSSARFPPRKTTRKVDEEGRF
jgi:putative transposase